MQPAEVLEEQSSLGSYLDAWLDHARGRVRPKTWQGYEALIRLYARPALGELALSELRPLHLQHLYAALLADPGRPLSGGTVLNLHLVLTQALGQAVRWGYLSSNPASGAQPPRPRRAEPAHVDAALSERILAAAEGTRFECLAAIAIATRHAKRRDPRPSLGRPRYRPHARSRQAEPPADAARPGLRAAEDEALTACGDAA